MNTSQKLAITPNHNQSENYPDFVTIDNESYFLLTEERLYDLERINGALQFLYSILWQSQQNADFNFSDLGDVLAYPAEKLHEVLREINSFKFK